MSEQVKAALAVSELQTGDSTAVEGENGASGEALLEPETSPLHQDQLRQREAGNDARKGGEETAVEAEQQERYAEERAAVTKAAAETFRRLAIVSVENPFDLFKLPMAATQLVDDVELREEHARGGRRTACDDGRAGGPRDGAAGLQLVVAVQGVFGLPRRARAVHAQRL